MQGSLSEQLLSCRCLMRAGKSYSFGVLNVGLIFFRGTVVLRNSYCYKDLFEASNFWKVIYLFQNTFAVVHSLKQCTYLKKGTAAGYLFFQTYWLLLEDQPSSLSHSFFQVRWFFSRNSSSRPFFPELYETDNFWQQILIKNSYFFGNLILGIWFF